MPDDTITAIRTRIVSRPLRLTFSTALGHKNTMTSVMVDVYCRDGSRGTGECATSFVLPNETAGKIQEILQRAKPEIIGRSAGEFPALIAGMRQRYNQFPMTVSGLETALFISRPLTLKPAKNAEKYKRAPINPGAYQN
jgi:L-alanine-DL-glutamate epimerase-like enolase superfamily enzyme